ncbi:MAG: PHP domain-containing protein [Dehalococcoidia bacterium]|nr:PHP domain-containing protein [Dehalococcoidia bacterium]
MKIDLHVHTNASDGRLSPAELVKLAVSQGVKLLAIADHDTVAGINTAMEAVREHPDVHLIPAIELSSHAPGNEVHVLGYFIRYDSQELASELKVLQDSRGERARAMVAKLQGLGMDINLVRVQEIAGAGSIGRPHIAQAIMEKGYVRDFREVFDKYLGHGGPAYVERHKLSPAQAVELILRYGGIPVLAHPTTLDLEGLLPELLTAGLAGLEVYYKDYSLETRQELANLAGCHRLIATGGTDYHGIESTEVMLGEADVPQAVAENLFALARQRGIEA